MVKEERNTAKAELKRFVQNNDAVLIFVLLWCLGAIIVPNFASVGNSLTILKQSAIPIITAIAMTLVLITGGIDLSTGYIVGLSSTLCGILMQEKGWGILPTLLAILVLGIICGAVNGVVVQLVKVPPFITTLGTGYVFYGLSNVACSGATISAFPSEFMAIGRTKLFGLTSTIYIALFIAVFFFIIVHRTTYGRSLSAIGLNSRAAQMSGINTTKQIILTYVISGLLAAVAGILLTIRVSCAQPDQGGPDYTFNAIVASVLGGACMNGGKGTVYGALLGVLSMTIIQNCLTMLNADAYMIKAILGVIIMLAVVGQNAKQRYFT